MSGGRGGLDGVGVGASTAGLVGLTSGAIRAGEGGWLDARTLVPVAVGMPLLFVFFRHERALSRRVDGEPLVDPELFRSRTFTWSVVLASLGVLTMTGVLFLLPQYFQGVDGADATESGFRLLPLIGGLAAGVASGRRGQASGRSPDRGRPAPSATCAPPCSASSRRPSPYSPTRWPSGPGVAASDPRIRNLAGAVVGVALTAMFTLAADPSADLAALLDEALFHLEAGFDL